jgi:RNA polymerase sigma-70 factor (ECF subfamily)
VQTHPVLISGERPTDTELIARILSGDMRALEALMRLHNRTLYRTARAILRDDAEAEDAVQEAYLQAYRALRTFRGESKLSTWLVRITANEALMRRRRNPKTADATERESVSDAPGPESDAERSEMRRLLEMHIDALPDAYRAVFVLRALEELTVPETAAALGIPDATVRTRYFRARGLLREWMVGDIDATQADAFAFAGARCDRIVRKVLAMLAAGIAATSLAACSEKPPRRERTLKQSESGRMSY